MAEFTLSAYHKEHGIGTASCRYFTGVRPRGRGKSQAVIAMICAAFIAQSPFEVWGDGTQIRTGRNIDDIVEGTILAGERNRRWHSNQSGTNGAEFACLMQ